MKMLDIQKHLRETLPFFDETFSVFKTATSASVLSEVLTISSAGHGLSVGEDITLKGFQLLSVVTVQGKPTILKADLNSATALDLYKDLEQIELQSNDPYYNGLFDLVEIQDRKNFQIKVNTSASPTPANEIKIIESYSPQLTGAFQVLSVIDSDSFTVSSCLPDGVEIIAGQFFSSEGDSQQIFASVDIERVFETYSKGAQPTRLYIVSADSQVSRNRNVKSDFANRIEGGTDIQIDMQEQFSAYVFLETTKSLDPVTSQDYCRNELKRALLKSLLAYQPKKVFNSEYDFIFFEGDAILTYSKAYYVHRYDFAVTMRLNADDGYEERSYPINSITTKYISDDLEKAQDKVIFN